MSQKALGQSTDSLFRSDVMKKGVSLWKTGLLGLVLVLVAAGAQVPWADRLEPAIAERPLAIDRGAAALWQSLLKLHTRASLLMMTAHPDDEDGGLLTYESRGRGTRVALLTLTRGESGQNLMTADYFDAMGLLRSEELLAADAYYGTSQYFGHVVDFGFSKSKQETVAKWSAQRPLFDAVRVVRLVRPLVVVSVFVGGPSDGHGHHQMAGEIAQRAFQLAGDPAVFPEQIQSGLRPWAPRKMYARVPTFAIQGDRIWDYADGHDYPLRFFNYITGQWIEGRLSADVVIPEGHYDPLLGATYAQIAREGLGMQRSQNGGVAVPPPGPADVAYHLFGSRVSGPGKADSLFAGLDVSLPGIADLAPAAQAGFLRTSLVEINALIEQAMAQFDARHPSAIAPLLASGQQSLVALIEKVKTSSLPEPARADVLYELGIKQAQFNAALTQALGLSVRVTVVAEREPTEPLARLRGPADTFRVAVPGQRFALAVRAAVIGDRPVRVRRVWVETPSGEDWQVQAQGQWPETLPAGGVLEQRFRVSVPDRARYTRPYFTRPSLHQAYYDITDPASENLPFAPYPVSGWIECEFDGVPVWLGQVAQTLQHQTGLGQVAEPLVVGPKLSLWVEPHAGVVPLAVSAFPLSVRVENNNKGPAEGTVQLRLPPGWSAQPLVAPFAFRADGQSQWLQFIIRPAQLRPREYVIAAEAHLNGETFREGYERVGYPGLRPYYFYRDAVYRLRAADLQFPRHLKIGYVAGTGDEIPQILETLGLHPVLLSDGDLARGDLSRFDVIVIGERAYSVRPALSMYNQRLLAYVRAGGVVVVQYQAADYDHQFAPYPLRIGRGQTVTDEDSAVQFLLPHHPALRWPNLISPADFQGWVEERGHGFPESWDSRWQALFEMHDPGQDPQRGGLLIAPYGRGEYVYVALALYRQLPEGIPGAYRLMANLLSLGRNPLLRSGRSASSRPALQK